MKNSKFLFILMLVSLALVSCKKTNTDPDGDITTGLHVQDGKYLADKCGNKVVLRGVNIGSVYAVNFGLKELEEIEKTGANTVRIVLERHYKDWSNGGALTPLTEAKIEPVITSCLAKGMIPVLELHDFTGSANVAADLPKATQWWTGAGIKSMLQKYQKSIIINIANEPDNGAASDASYADANTNALKVLRDAGYTCPIMIDAPNWGKDHVFFLYKGQALMDADPLHNLLFSVHAYWPTNGPFGNYSDAKITADFAAMKQENLPIVIGELAIADIQNGLAYNINYRLLMKLCKENEFGYIAWWWGFNNNPGANNQLSMTNNGLYSGLAGSGKAIAVDDANSIKNTAKRTCQ
ncbi:cellulase family glycosylhydrolase [Pedobacter psychrodurus]|uniref:cellulase family glycosylhydrolase n=1 Tax=Pedobacter psychrodurus TaxID=2530456 RepID=UPI00292E8325|nr:cellulase family glycosylhydrolase [Pedobacter psychrodurus]